LGSVDGPLGGELGWGEVTVGRVGSVDVDSIRQSSMSTRASGRLSKWRPLRNSSRKRPLKLSIQAFRHGEPGSMKIGAVPWKWHRRNDGVSWAMNSGPLSKRTRPDSVNV